MSVDAIMAEKHLDMPSSWVERLDISNIGKQLCRGT
jgi:hypothetical protein